jgi:hypothetical protein
MKKSILTIGLFSLVMVLTSFTTPETNNIWTNSGIFKGQEGSAGGNMKWILEDKFSRKT